MDPQEKLALINTCNRGGCMHTNRVNICVECLAVLAKIVKEAA